MIYKNVGKKIRILACVQFGLGVLVSILIALCFYGMGLKYADEISAITRPVVYNMYDITGGTETGAQRTLDDMSDYVGKSSNKTSFHEKLNKVTDSLENTVSVKVRTRVGIFAVIIVIVGSVMAWVNSLTLYGYGQLIDDNERTRQSIEKVTDGMKQLVFICKNRSNNAKQN